MLSLTSKYIKDEFGDTTLSKFLKKVHHTAELLTTCPKMGSVEELLSGGEIIYRSIVINGINKMVYYLDNDQIIIAAFWDARSEPEKLKTLI